MNPAHPLSLRLASWPLLVAVGLAGCSSINEKLQGDKVDYRSTAANKTVSLEVPPDLTQLTRDSRYQPASGVVSASTLQGAVQPGSTAAAAQPVAPAKAGAATLERAGTQRWLSTPLTPEQLWPQLQAFWQERGFQLELEQRDTGLMETNWAENRAKLPQDIIRSTIGKIFDSVYETGERDRFRTRLERAADGRTEVYISHRGMIEVYSTERKDSTVWQPRQPDPDLEALMLSRLMLKLGGQEDQAKAVVTAAGASAPAPAASRARLLGSAAAGLQVDDGFERAWRRVGLALDRNGFTVEDRDRLQGQYFVRYVDPTKVGKAEPGFFSKLFGGDKAAEPGSLARYRIALKSEANTTLVTVLDNQGAPANGATAQRILELLVTELR